jgi:hypothetical protein
MPAAPRIYLPGPTIPQQSQPLGPSRYRPTPVHLLVYSNPYGDTATPGDAL